MSSIDWCGQSACLHGLVTTDNTIRAGPLGVMAQTVIFINISQWLAVLHEGKYSQCTHATGATARAGRRRTTFFTYQTIILGHLGLFFLRCVKLVQLRIEKALGLSPDRIEPCGLLTCVSQEGRRWKWWDGKIIFITTIDLLMKGQVPYVPNYRQQKDISHKIQNNKYDQVYCSGPLLLEKIWK